LVTFTIENHITHFFVTFMTMLQLFIGLSFFQWDKFSHYFHLRRPLYGPLVAKVPKNDN